MLSNIVQKLNKSFNSSNSDVIEKSPNAKTSPIKRKKSCKLCKGAGCCLLCDRPDDWENMVYCSNKSERLHLLHPSCDNLTPDMVKLIKNYYCPNCREDQFQVTFYKKASASKIEEISEILNLKPNDNLEKISITLNETPHPGNKRSSTEDGGAGDKGDEVGGKVSEDFRWSRRQR